MYITQYMPFSARGIGKSHGNYTHDILIPILEMSLAGHNTLLVVKQCLMARFVMQWPAMLFGQPL